MKMNVEKLLLEIKEHQKIVRDNQRSAAKKQQLVAETLCPFSVGERVLNGNGEEEVIAIISWSGVPGDFNVGYSFGVKKIKKNGEVYKDKSYAYNQEKYTKANT